LPPPRLLLFLPPQFVLSAKAELLILSPPMLVLVKSVEPIPALPMLVLTRSVVLTLALPTLDLISVVERTLAQLSSLVKKCTFFVVFVFFLIKKNKKKIQNCC
jgi:hypothetical protein